MIEQEAVIKELKYIKKLNICDVSNSLPLDKIEKKIDLLLEKETEESLRKWLNDKRQF